MADELFTDLPVAIALNGTEIVPIDHPNGDGTFTTERTTTGAIAALGGGGGGSGTVTSVGLALPAELLVSGSPITIAGTLGVTWAVQAANVVFAGPTSGGSSMPSFRALVSADIPTLNQNTTGSAAKWTTARTLAGNSVDGSANVAFANKFIVQGTADSGLSGAQFLGALGTGILKNATSTGVLSVAAAGTDYQAPITLTTTGTSGAATLISNTLNIPQYTGGGGGNVNAGGTLTSNALVIGQGTTSVAVVPGIVTDGTSKITVGVAGSSVGSIGFQNATSGTLTLAPPTGALVANTLTLPLATDTLVGKATTDTLTNKTLTSPVINTSLSGSAFGTGVATWLTTPSSANLAAAITDETGSGALVFANTPTLVTPVLGAATGTSLQLSGLTASSAVATDASKNLVSVTNTGTGNNVLASAPTLTSPVINTGLSGTAFGTGVTNWLNTPTSANLATAVTDETGSGSLVFATSPTLVTPTIGAASGTSLNLSGLTASSAVATDGSKNLVSVTNTGTGSNVLAASPTLVTPALGTPSAVVLTNATGTASGLTAGVTNALASATTTINVSSSTAPSAGQVLTATDSTHATWQAGGGGGMTLLATLATTTGTSVTATGLPTTFNYFFVDFIGVNTASNTGPPILRAYISSDNGSSFGTAQSWVGITGVTSGGVFIFNIGNAAASKAAFGQYSQAAATGTINTFDGVKTGLTNSMKFDVSSSAFSAGSILIYGVN